MAWKMRQVGAREEDGVLGQVARISREDLAGPRVCTYT